MLDRPLQRLLKSALAGLLCCVMWAAQAHAAGVPGELDPAFGDGGKVLTPIGSGGDWIEAMAIDGQGRIVVAGRSLRAGEEYITDFAVARYTPSGALDTSFGGDGTVVTQLGPLGSGATSVAIDPEGRIVAGGLYAGSFALARYAMDGELDAGFGQGGTVTTPIGDQGGEIRSIAIHPEGWIVAGGYTVNGVFHFFRDLTVVRYRDDGSFDPAYAGIQHIGGNSNSSALAIAIDAHGRAVAAGYTGPITGTDTLVARFDGDGHRDASFDGDGLATANFGDFSAAGGIAIDSEERIVTAGSTASDGDRQISLARFRPDGSLDDSFGAGGRVTTWLDNSSGANAVAIDGRGRIVVAGALPYGTGNDSDFAIVRYLPDGSVDGSFGNAGAVTTAFGAGDSANGVAIGEENRIVAAGYGDNGSDADFALARYLGEPDTRAPQLQLSGTALRELGRKVSLRVGCDERCTVEAGGRVTVRDEAGRREVRRLRFALKPAGAELGAGESTVLKPKLSRRELRRVERKLSRSDATALAKLTVHATDAAGNEGIARRTVRLRP